MVEIRVAWGAGRGSCEMPSGPPTKPLAAFSRLRITGITAEPATTPITRATCWRHGVASTSWPVFRSWRLSFEMTATAKTMPVINSAKATIEGSAGMPKSCIAPSIRTDATRMARMPTPETGLFDEPIRPAI